MGAPIPISSNERIQSRTVSTPLPTATRGPDACDTQRAAQGHSGIRHYDTELPDWPETTGDTRDRTPWYAFNGTGGSQLLMTPPGDLYTCGTMYPGIDAAQSLEQTSSRCREVCFLKHECNSSSSCACRQAGSQGFPSQNPLRVCHCVTTHRTDSTAQQMAMPPQARYCHIPPHTHTPPPPPASLSNLFASPFDDVFCRESA